MGGNDDWKISQIMDISLHSNMGGRKYFMMTEVTKETGASLWEN